MSAIIVNSNNSNTFQLGFAFDAKLTSVHFPGNEQETEIS